MKVTAKDVIVLWEVSGDEYGAGHRAAVSIVQFTIFKNTNHLVAVRDDSTLEIYSLTDVNVPAQLEYEVKESETITGLVVGNITSSRFKEIMISCYSGAIKSLVHKKQLAKMGTLNEDAPEQTEK